MKKFITILISCSLALAASAFAQQEEGQTPPAEKKQAEKGKGHAADKAKPAGEERAENGVRPANEAKPAKPESAHKGHAETNAPADTTGAPKAANPESPAMATAPEKAVGQNPKAHSEQHKKEHNAPAEAATANKAAAPAAASPAASASTPANASASTPTPAAATASTAAPAASTPASAVTTAASPAAVTAPQVGKVNPQAKKPDAQAIQAIKAQHVNFRAQPRPQQVPSVTFNQGYRINGSDQWQGEQYGVFRSYHPELHDQNFYRSRYSRVEVIGGGAYYLNQGYWYPAWGYDRSAQYYAYDGPIYVGHRTEPPDRIIADVQATLQQAGYYRGEVDGLLGPLTRQALTAYQSDNGLYTTAAIDEPTLNSLDLG